MTWYQRSKLVSKLFLSNLAPDPKQLSRSRWKMGFSRFVHQGTPNTVLLDAERRSSNTDKKRFSKVAVFSSVAAAATAICCYNIEFTPYKGRPHVVLVPRYLEKKLLESKIRKIKEEFREDILPPEHPYTARVGLITKHLSEAPYLEPHGLWYKTQSIGSLFPEYLNWEVMVIDRPIVKVCCYDAKVVIFTGLLDRLESDAEIATVIGHEIGHDLARHAAEKITKKPWTTFWKQSLYIFLDWEIDPFFRKIEREADFIGLMVMAAAGYDPSVAANVYDRLSDDMVLSDYCSTLPDARKRASLLVRREVMGYAMSAYNLIGKHARAGVQELTNS